MTQPGESESRSLTVLALGEVPAESCHALSRHFSRIEQIDVDVPPRARLVEHGALLNRAIDAAAADWILILRQREVVGESLAGEIAQNAVTKPGAWGYRLRSEPFYAGKPLRLGAPEPGEIRLIHRRHSRFDRVRDREEIMVQGAVVRLTSPLRAETFESAAAHRGHLQRYAVPHSFLRRLLLFLHDAIVTGAWRKGGITLQYLWIEAGYDQGKGTRAQ